MIGERKARKLFDKALYMMHDLISISDTDTVNQRIQLKAYTMIWELKQVYIGQGSKPYMTKKAYNSYLERIKTLKVKIIEEKHKKVALKAVEDAEKYLNILADNFVRDTRKPRVF